MNLAQEGLFFAFFIFHFILYFKYIVARPLAAVDNIHLRVFVFIFAQPRVVAFDGFMVK
jgi:hypothetical protein